MDYMDDKIKKLTNAVYRVLEFFPESDPLKNRAKDKALEIMHNPKVEDIDVLLGYLWIGKMQGWINSVNFLIISNEYEKLKGEIKFTSEVRQSPIEEPVQFQFLPKRVVESKKKSEESKLSGRQKQIVDYLNKNERGQVMDLQRVLPKVTKRTIRRDLDSLLEAGRVIREGDFNQVVYKLARTGQSEIGHIGQIQMS